MARLSENGVLIAGILSPPVAAYLGMTVYATLTRDSADLDRSFVYRLSMVILAMTVPFALTLALALWNRRGRALTRIEKRGLGIAVLSLALLWFPVSGLVVRWQQSRNLAVRDEAAPLFNTLDLSGRPHRLEDHAGKVVLVNIWATWCFPCREEMPKLDRLHREKRDEGLVVFGLSTEDVDLQRKFVQEIVPVSYPLLTVSGDVPGLYRNIARLPAIILIDRSGRLQPAPGPDKPFGELEATVDALLKADSD